MSDRPKASAPKTPARKAATAGAPAAKSGSGSWLAGFITRAAAGIVYAVVFILCLVWVSCHGHLCFRHERSVLL